MHLVFIANEKDAPELARTRDSLPLCYLNPNILAHSKGENMQIYRSYVMFKRSSR